MTKFGSRKFIVTCIQILIMILLPIVYRRFEVSDSITMTVLVSLAAAGSFYTGFNVLDKKITKTIVESKG